MVSVIIRGRGLTEQSRRGLVGSGGLLARRPYILVEGQRSHVDQEASGLGVPKREALVTHQVDVLFRHVVIQDDPDGHHGGGSG